MSRRNGLAICNQCGRMVSYKSKTSSSSESGCLIGCLAVLLAGLFKWILIGGLILLGIVLLVIIIGVVWILV